MEVAVTIYGRVLKLPLYRWREEWTARELPGRRTATPKYRSPTRWT